MISLTYTCWWMSRLKNCRRRIILWIEYIIGIFVIKNVVAIKIALIQNNRFVIVSLQPTIRVNMLGHKEEFIL